MRNNLSNEDLLEVIRLEKESAGDFRSRRVPEWDETYLYYRNKVITNRITQRQSANIPLMKTVIKSILKDTDDSPMISFKHLGNNDQAELFFNEAWTYQSRMNKMKLQDIMDKKNGYLFGRTFKQLNIRNGIFYWEVVDPKDVRVHRFVHPAMIDTARFMCRDHIYMALNALQDNPAYDKAAVKSLTEYYQTVEGILEGETNMEDFVEKNDRMLKMGDDTVTDPVLGETFVELSDCFLYLYDAYKEKEVLYYVCVADDREILIRKPLYEMIGETRDQYWDDHLPFTTWGDDTERQDFWSDGIGDTIRQLNRILNSWFASMVENRTLKNFGMMYYNATKNIKGQKFIPQTFNPQPYGWYPLPGDPNEIIKRVEVGDLKDSIEEINFLVALGEKATAATSTQQGQIEPKKVTLGEIQLALANAQERVKSIANFYNDSWYEFGVKYTKMMEAAYDILDPIETSKKGRLTDRMYSRTIQPKEWLSDQGYEVEVKPIVDKTQEDVEAVQKLKVAQQDMPDNKPLRGIIQKKELEFAGLTPDEAKEVMDWEKDKEKAIEDAVVVNGGMPGSQNQPAMLGGGAPAAIPAKQPIAINQ